MPTSNTTSNRRILPLVSLLDGAEGSLIDGGADGNLIVGDLGALDELYHQGEVLQGSFAVSR